MGRPGGEGKHCDSDTGGRGTVDFGWRMRWPRFPKVWAPGGSCPI